MAVQAYRSNSFLSGAVPKIGPDFAREIASRQATEFLFASFLGEDEHPSPIVRDKSEPGDRVGEVYERMLNTDATLAGLWEKRAKAVTGLPWSIIPGDESDEAQQIADLVTEAVYGIANIETNLAHQLQAVAKGVSFDEILWKKPTRGKLAGYWTFAQLIDRPMWRFGFKNGVLHVRTKDGQLAPVPPGRVLQLTHGTKDSPWGLALLDRVWWFYWLGLHAWKYYGVALEKWAQPTVKVTYKRDAEGTDNRSVVDESLAIAGAVQTEYAIAVPEGIDVDLIEAIRSGAVSYENFIALLDRAKALVFLGEPDTSGMSQGPGSYAKNRVANEVRYETIVADACELANSLTDGLIAPFVRVNFGLDVPMPYWEFEVEEADDRVRRQEGMEKVLDRGEPVARSAFYRTHQCQIPKPGEEVVTRGRAAASAPTPPGEAAPVPPPVDWAEQELDAA